MEQKLKEFVDMVKTQVGIVQDDNVRKQNEELIKQFKVGNPDLYVQLVISALQQDADVHVRMYCASQIRKNLSDFSEKSFENLWNKINEETKQIFKTQIFICLDGESASNIRSLICDCIGEVGGCLLNPIGDENKGKNFWPELLQIVQQLFTTERVTMIESGYRIISNLLIYSQDSFINMKGDLKQLLIQGLNNQDISVKVAAFEAIGSFVESLAPKEIPTYEDMVPLMMETTVLVLNQDEDLGERILEVLSEIAEEDPKLLKKNFSLVFNSMHKIINSKNIDNSGIKKIALETLVLVIERFPIVIKNNNELKNSILELIFMFMIDMDEEIEQKWKCPPEGFRECFTDDGDNANTNLGINYIDRLMESVSQDKIMPVLSELIQNLLQNPDWRYTHAALMALSQLGEHLDEVSDIQNIMPVIMQYMDNANPKIKFAALHAIGQISDDMQPEFQSKYHSQVIPAMIKCFDDQVPRVQSHALASMSNFLEGSYNEQIKPYLQGGLQKCFALLENGISLVKENALAAISGFAEAAGEDFNQYYKEVIPIIFNVYNQYPAKEYKQLRGCVVEAITIIGDAIDHDLFVPYLPDTVQLILKIQDADLDQIDPQKNFVLTGWSRLCKKFPKEFVQFLPNVIPSTVKVIEAIVQYQEALCDDENTTEEVGGGTYQHREASTAMNMLEVFIENLGDDLGPYIQQLTQIILPLCNFQADEDIRCQASKCLPGLVKSIVKQNRQVAINLTKEFIQLLYAAAEKEFDAETITSQIQGMKGCIDEVGEFLTKEELQQLAEKIINLLMESDKRKDQNKQVAGELDEDEQDIYEIDTTHEEKLHVAIAELLGIFFKTHADLCNELANLIYTKFLPTVLADGLSDKMHQFGVFLVDDMVEHLGFNRVGDKWPHLAEALVKFSNAQNLQVRQAAVYGIGQFAEKTPVDQFSQYSQVLIENVVKAIEMKCGENQNEKSYKHCTDNGIAALGKICKAQWTNIQQISQVLDFWSRQLPLKKDKDEAYIQHAFLCDIILENNTSQVFLQNQENYAITVKVFAKILKSKVCNKDVTEKIRRCMQLLANNDFVKNNWANITSGIPQDQINNLQEVSQ